MSFSILVAEDDLSISELIKMTLEIGGMNVFVVHDGHAAQERIKKKKDDVAILDIMLPKIDGFQLLESTKKAGIPAIFVTAKAQIAEKVHGLRLGAEDYIVKPFEPLELLARVETVLRRIPKEHVLIFMDIQLDQQNHSVTKAGELIALTPKEYELLELFMCHPNIVFTRDQLLNRIWGFDYYGSTRTVDMHIQKLRSKLGLESHFQTLHRVGYQLVKTDG